uniref:Ribosomal protein S20 n=1 Tax=Olisthodiscus luteus TaxID=83000 RepID=A0A7U0KRV0_OLILU|nr:ribosomal protein S20 [Olisthodiscus luteus]QQW50525.1 ribosomal protein S20 [Olisthodiscus luteus]
MANIKSSKKRIAINRRNRLRNRIQKSIVKTYIKKYSISLENFILDPTESQQSIVEKNLSQIYQKFDKAQKSNVFHKNKVARKKSQLATALSKAIKKK